MVIVDHCPGPLGAGPDKIGSLPPFQLPKVEPFQKLPEFPTVTPPEFDEQSENEVRHPMNVKPVPESRIAPPVPVVQVPLLKVMLLKVKELLSDTKLFRSVVSCPVDNDPVQGLVQLDPSAGSEQAASAKAIER
jgi:hypothetical protein